MTHKSSFLTRLLAVMLLVAAILILSVGGSAAQEPEGQPPAPQDEGTAGQEAQPQEVAALAAAEGTAFTYQGQLKNGAALVNGACDFQFGLFDAPTDGARIGNELVLSNVSVKQGLFTVELDFGSAFNGDARYLEVKVRCPGGSGEFTTLAPRQALRPVPYALALPGLRIQPAPAGPSVIGGSRNNRVAAGLAGVTVFGGGDSKGGGNQVLNSGSAFATLSGGRSNEAAGAASTVGGGAENRARSAFSVIGGGRNNVAGASGNVQSDNTVGGGFSNEAWGVGSTVSGGTNNSAGIFPGTLGESANTVAGGSDNIASSTGATVGGGLSNTATRERSTIAGGNDNTASGLESTVGGGFSNEARGEHATVAGGEENEANGTNAIVAGGFSNAANGVNSIVGGGNNNTAAALESTIGGGLNNVATGAHDTVGGGRDNLSAGLRSTIGGGFSNETRGEESTVAGGEDNTASGHNSTVSGGLHNAATGDYASVPGGLDNIASGSLSFAAGHNARAVHTGAFVWADGFDRILRSTRDHQFLVRAGGGAAFLGGSLDVPSATGAALQAENGRSTGEVAWFRSVNQNSPHAVLKLVRDPDGTNNFLECSNWNGPGTSESRRCHINRNGTFVAGSDFAEALPALGGAEGYEPGDVLVLSATEPGAVAMSGQPYDTALAGVYSTNPAVLGAEKDGEIRVDPNDVPVAIVGIVPTKVSAENGAIRPGDLLTTAATPGHAMLATPVEVNGVPIYPTGAILGKAIEPLESGTGVILVLVTLR